MSKNNDSNDNLALIREPAETYFTHARDYLTSHQLADFRKCPLLYKQKRAGLVPDYYGPAFDDGAAAHTLILEGEAVFESQYIVGGPINPKTGKPFGEETKRFAEWQAESGKRAVSDDQFALITQMRSSVRRHETAARLLADGEAESVIRLPVDHSSSGFFIGVPAQIRMDWFNPAIGCGFIVDLKTCQNLDDFSADARRYGYFHQLAFYRSVFEAWCDPDMRPQCRIVAVEKRPPYRCGVFKPRYVDLDTAERDNDAAIAELLECQSANHWPTRYEETRIL